MGALFGGSKSSTEVFSPTVGGQTSGAPVSALAVEGHKSTQNVNVYQTYTDQGAINRGLESVDEAVNHNTQLATDSILLASDVSNTAIRANENVTSDVIDANQNVLNDVIRFGQGILDGAADIVRDALAETSMQQERAMMAAEAASANARATMGEAIESNTLVSRDAMDLSRSVVDLTGDINQQNIDFLGGTLIEVTETLGQMDQSRSQQAEQSLEAITELATVVQTGGESINANVNKMIAGLAIVTAGFIAWRALA